MKHLPKNVTSDHNKQKKNTTLHKEMWKIVCSFNILKSLTKKKKKKKKHPYFTSKGISKKHG